MHQTIQEKLHIFLVRNRHRRILRKFVQVMCCIVVFVTTYMLILPAITLEPEVFCGIEEHIHTQECYESVVSTEPDTAVHVHTESCNDPIRGDLICTAEESPSHTHDSGCFEVTDILQCSKPENHIHDDSCRKYPLVCILSTDPHIHDSSCLVKGELTCTLGTDPDETGESHSHGDSCYASAIVCGREEGDAHSHGADCYSPDPELVCLLPENHTHEASCYQKTLICELEETAGHSHSDDCYQWENQYICGLEEGEAVETEQPEPAQICTLEAHSHTLACCSNPNADTETAGVWQATFVHVERTGDWPTDVVAIAESQLGYTESTRNYNVWEDNTIHGYTRYGAWYGVPYGDWCGMFVSFCLNYAGVEGMPYNYGVRPWIEDLEELDLYYSPRETKPQKGNLIFFDWDEDGLGDHVGIVAEFREAQPHMGATVKTIEGNSDNAVRYQYYDPESTQILGYGLLPGQERIPVEQKEENPVPELICGLEEHTHSHLCFDEEGNILCQAQEHCHTEECQETPTTYYCGLMIHAHSAACHDGTGQLVCPYEEHNHDDACTVNPAEVYFESISESVVITYSAIRREEEEPVPAMFRMTSPMTVAENEVPSWSSPIDLEQYVLYYRGTITASLLTMGNTVPSGDEIERGKQYQLSLYFAVPEHGMEQGTYVYKFPDGFDYTPQSGSLYDSSKQVLLGTWDLQTDGTMVFEFTEESNNYQTVAMTATIRTTVSENVVEIPFDGKIFVVVDPEDSLDKPTEVTKFGTGMIEENGNWVESTHNFTRIKWTVVFTPGTNGLVPGTPVKDTLMSDLHHFSDADKAAGISIGFSDAGEDWHQIIVPPESISWNPNNDGFEFTLPDTSCRFCNNRFQYFDGRKYYITYYTTVQENLPDGYYMHENMVVLDNQVVHAHYSLQIGAPTAAIVKSGRLNEETHDYEWSIQAMVPAYETGQVLYWKILDRDHLAYQDTYWTPVYEFTFNENMFQSITAEVNGVTFEVPHVSEVTVKDRYCYKFDSESIYFASRCECSVDHCATNPYTTDGWWCNSWYWEEPLSVRDEVIFCGCWTEANDVVFNVDLVYDIEAIAEQTGVNIINTYGGLGLRFYNTAIIQGHYTPSEGAWELVESADVVANVGIPGMFSKEELPPYPNQNNDYIATYKITVNNGKLDLSRYQGDGTFNNVQIVDVMSDTLYYVRGSMVITQVDVDNNTTVLHYGTDYDMHVNGHTITIDLLYPGPYQYILEYNAQIIVDIEEGQKPEYSNNAIVSIKGTQYNAAIDYKQLTQYQYTAKKYSVTLEKTSSHDGKPLPGAVFGLFAESGLEIARDTTDANGDITFETDLKKFIVFKMHMPYYLQEISAPDGYILDDTKHWFYFCNHEGHGEGGSPCDLCTNLNNAYPYIVEIGRTNGEDTHEIDIEVQNTYSMPILPETGGAGTELYTAGGTLLILAAVMLLLYSHKLCRKEDLDSS